MTCIVGVVDKGTVYIGGDSAGVSAYSITPRADKKVFINRDFAMGFTTSFRMGQLLQYKLVPPDKPKKCSDYKFMVVDFVDAVKKCFKENDYGLPDKGGCFLVGFNSNLYAIDDDFQVGINCMPFDSVGCGSEIAKGSLFSTVGKKPMDRVKLALKAAATLNGGVCAPFNIVKLMKTK